MGFGRGKVMGKGKAEQEGVNGGRRERRRCRGRGSWQGKMEVEKLNWT